MEAQSLQLAGRPVDIMLSESRLIASLSEKAFSEKASKRISSRTCVQPCGASREVWLFRRLVAPLDGATATVPNARWRKVICAESLESLSLETKQPA